MKRDRIGALGVARTPDLVGPKGLPLWYCHGCGFAHPWPFEACCFCPDDFLADRGDTDEPHGQFRRELRQQLCGVAAQADGSFEGENGG